MSFRVYCADCKSSIRPPFWGQYGKPFCSPKCAESYSRNKIDTKDLKELTREEKLEQENKMMRECLEKLVVMAEHIGAYEDAKLILNKLTRDER
jgi:hypothetical protein